MGQPDAHNRIDIQAYTVAEKDKACSMMALATPLQASLNLGSFPQGHYSVWLNNARVGEFELVIHRAAPHWQGDCRPDRTRDL